LLAREAEQSLSKSLLFELVALVGVHGQLMESVLLIVEGLIEKLWDDVRRNEFSFLRAQVAVHEA
jgi:hypothetical protein